MPVNSFENYYMSWKPAKSGLQKPLYLSLAALLEQDIQNGILQEGVKLPPQRELADFLDISLNTVTKAYTICEKKGLIHAITGSGTFVAESVHVSKSVISQPDYNYLVELGYTVPYFPSHSKIIATIAQTILKRADSSRLFEHHAPLGTTRQKKAAIAYLQLFGIHADMQNILITNGTQNALTLLLNALFHEGDKIAVDKYTYSNFIGLANLLGVQLVPIACDEHGIVPAHLEKACKTAKIKGVYLSPSCANPTGICMPQFRRNALAPILKQYHMLILEDEASSVLSSQDELLSFFHLLPEQTVYLASLSKYVGVGLRVSYLCFPAVLKSALENALFQCNLMVNPLNAQIATELIEQDIHLQMIKEKTESVLVRNQLFKSLFASYKVHSSNKSFYQWLPLPNGITGQWLEAQAKKEGIRLYAGERFLVGDSAGQYFARIATCAPKSEDLLLTGLTTIKALLEK